MAQNSSLQPQAASAKQENTPDLLVAARNAAATIGAIYEWVERVEKAGGATSISGVAACHAMLTSLRKNAPRTERLVMAPLREALARPESTGSAPARVISKLSHPLLDALRERGHSDERIAAMTAERMFDEYCNWHGLIEWGPNLRAALASATKAAKAT